jgi:26S proteasome regulatory subunit, ATPase 3, interacting protein
VDQKEEDLYYVRLLAVPLWFSWPPHRDPLLRSFWHMIIDALSPQDAAALAEDLGIEFDTPEHQALERGPLCAKPVAVVSSKKRKRD